MKIRLVILCITATIYMQSSSVHKSYLRGRFCLFLRLVFLVGLGRIRRYQNNTARRITSQFWLLKSTEAQ